jgi:RimJ/RimL family protein N-acetyltransferase
VGAGPKPTLPAPGLTLVPARTGDIDRLCDLLWKAEVRRFLCDDRILPRDVVAGMMARSERLDAEALGTWMIEAAHDGFVGMAALQPVSEGVIDAGLAGGVEPMIALYPRAWGRGLARQAIDALATHAGTACQLECLVAAVDEPNARSHHLMRSCSFTEIGRGPGPKHRLVFYERRLAATR